jgi:tetratricopeptide (TPR) repeat protein
MFSLPAAHQRILLAVLVSAALAGCSGKEERIASHLAKGESYFAKAETDKALVEVHNVLQMDPRRAEAYYLAGQVEEDRGNVRSAYANFNKAFEIKPTYSDAEAAMGRLELVVGNDAQAKKRADDALARDPSNVQAQVLQAAIMAHGGDIDGAIAIASQASKGDAIPSAAAAVLAGLYTSKRDYPKALEVVQKSLVANPNDVTLLQIAAKLSQAQHQPEQVTAFYKRAAETAPKNFVIWENWAAFHEQNGHPAAAEEVLRDAIKAAPDESARRIALVNMIGRHEGEDVGLKQLVGFAKDRPRDYPVNFALVSYYKKAGKIEDARHVLETLSQGDEHGQSGQNAENELAVLDLESGNSSAARARIEKILKVNPRNSGALLLRAQLEMTDKKFDVAIADLRAAGRESPDSVPVLRALAEAYTANNQPDLARDTLADAAKLFPNRPQITILWMQYLVARGDFPAAINAADAAVRRDSKNVTLITAKAGVEEKAKDFAGAEATLRNGAESLPHDARLLVQLAQLQLREKKNDQALASFDEAAAADPNAIEPRAAALQLLMTMHRNADAEKRVDQIIASIPQRALGYQLQGDVLLAENHLPQAEAAYRKAIEIEPVAATAYLNLANFLSSQKRNNEVQAVFEQGLKANPRDGTLQNAEADFLTKTGQYDQAIAVYERQLRENSANAVAANNLAYLLIDVKGDKASLERAHQLTKGFEFAVDPGFLDTLAWMHYKEGQFDQALPIYQRAALLAPNAPLLEMHYGMTLYKSGDKEHGKEELKLAASQGRKLPPDAQQILDQG